MRWRCRRAITPGRAASCSDVNAARIVAAVVEMFRCRPAAAAGFRYALGTAAAPARGWVPR